MSEGQPIVHDQQWLLQELAHFSPGASSEVTSVNQLLQSTVQSEPMIEAYLPTLGTRVIAMSKDAQSATLHPAMVERHLPVLSSFHTEKLTLLLVPDGAKRISAILPALNRDPVGYRRIFFDVGRILRDLQVHNLGLPELSILDRIVFATQEEGEGGRLYLCPPYEFGDPISREQELEQLRFELELSGAVSPDAIDVLVGQVEDGWDAIG